MYELKKMERYLRVNLLGPGPCLIKKKNLLGRGLTKVEKHLCTGWSVCTHRASQATKLTMEATTRHHYSRLPRGELSYLAPLGSEKISAPYFKQCFFRGGGGYYPPD